MAINDIPILSMLRTRLEWAQSRQKVLAENVANADTPGFQARDLHAAEIRAGRRPAPRAAPGRSPSPPPSPAISPASAPAPTSFRSHNDGHYEVRPTGNAVNLEEEMMKVAANQMDFQTATALYAHSLNLIKIGLGKK